MAKKFVIILLVFAFLAGLALFTKAEPKDTSSKIKVVSTTAMIAELVSQIAQEKVQSEFLIKGDIDPHSYELVKGDQAKLKSAAVIFYQGLGLEHGASLVSYLNAESKALAIGEVVRQKHPELLIYHDGYLDPHIWLDLNLWEKLVLPITEKLVEISPENKEFFEKNTLELTQNMQRLDVSIQSLLQDIPENKRYLVTAHSAFSYFTRRYISHEGSWQNRCIAPEGLAPEAQISLYDIEKVVAFIGAHGVQVIFSESNVSKDAMHKILDVCKKTGLQVKLASAPLFGDALFNEKGYLDMMWHNATLLHQAWHEESIPTQD
jgi:manganese/zinc/iron transport system substrate-binding protein